MVRRQVYDGVDGLGRLGECIEKGVDVEEGV